MNFSQYATPYRYDRAVLTGSGVPGTYNAQCVDCPFVFQHNERFFMLHIGFDGVCYRTALAVSDDLLHWEPYAVVLDRLAEPRWDRVGASGNWIIRENNTLDGVPTLRKIRGKYWMSYHAYPLDGYEQGPASISFACCADEDLLHWERLDKPVLRPEDGVNWEHSGLYRSSVIPVGDRYYMFYNAKDAARNWHEQTGAAVSQDLLHWERVSAEPLLRVTPGAWDSRFVSDPYIVQDGEWWLNFYFGFDAHHAQEGLAWSRDLLHWEKSGTPLLANGAPGSEDETHAHKGAVFRHNGILYHYYCAVRPSRPGDNAVRAGCEYRCIRLAASKPLN